MAYVSKKSAVVYVTDEVTEGTAVDPSAGTEAVGVLADGFELNGSKELVERSLLQNGISKQVPRTGIKSSSVALGVEASANSTTGGEPDYSLLLKSLLGGKRQITTVVTSATGHTTTDINIEDTDISDFSVGDIILIKEAGAYHLSPISAVDDSAGAAKITILIPANSAFSDNVEIEKSTIFYGANTGHENLTITNYFEDALKIQSAGCKVTSMSLENFETGQLPSFNFSLEGLSYAESLGASGLTASYSNATPPIALDACLYLDGTLVAVNNVSLSVDNSLGRVTSTCNSNGVISQLVTERAISGSFTPYLDTTDVDLFSKFNLNTEFSLFLRAWNPTSTAGEKQNAWGIFIPKAIITEMPKADQDGTMQYNISFSAGSDSEEVYSSDFYMGFC